MVDKTGADKTGLDDKILDEPPAPEFVKPKGGDSATSILQTVLHIARIISWIVVVVMGFSIAFAVFDGLSGGASGDKNLADVVNDLLQGLASVLIIYIAGYLLGILKTIKAGTPFEQENAMRLRKIGRIIITVEAVKWAVVLFGFLFFVQIETEGGYEVYTIGDSAMALLAAAIAYTLARVFEEGARLKQEQDYTI